MKSLQHRTELQSLLNFIDIVILVCQFQENDFKICGNFDLIFKILKYKTFIKRNKKLKSTNILFNMNLVILAAHYTA